MYICDCKYNPKIPYVQTADVMQTAIFVIFGTKNV